MMPAKILLSHTHTGKAHRLNACRLDKQGKAVRIKISFVTDTQILTANFVGNFFFLPMQCHARQQAAARAVVSDKQAR